MLLMTRFYQTLCYFCTLNMKTMKHIITVLLICSLMIPQLLIADEGMWLVHLIGAKTFAQMQKRGLKLSKEQLYDINKSSIKDAIAIDKQQTRSGDVPRILNW